MNCSFQKEVNKILVSFHRMNEMLNECLYSSLEYEFSLIDKRRYTFNVIWLNLNYASALGFR